MKRIIATMFVIGNMIIMQVACGEDDSELTSVEENSDQWDQNKSVESTPISDAEELLEDEEQYDMNFSSITDRFVVGSEWYGVMSISNYLGKEDVLLDFGVEGEGDYDVVAYIGYDEVYGSEYFELYTMDAEYPIVSYYTELQEYYFEPVINEYAWLFYSDLNEVSAWDLSPSMLEGELSAYSDYDYEGVSFYMEFFMREIGANWNEGYDPMPPSYDTYVLGENPLLPSDDAIQAYYSTSHVFEDKASSDGVFTTEELIRYYDSFDYTLKTYDELVEHYDGIHPIQSYYNEEYSEYRYTASDDEYVYAQYIIYYEEGEYVIRGQVSEGLNGAE